MKYMWGIVIAILLIVIIALAVYIRSYTANPSMIHFANVTVSSEMITLRNGSFAGSSMWYSGYSAQYQSGVLSIEIHARSVKIFGSADDPFTVSIPNTYGDIQQVQLSDGEGSNKLTIWNSSK